MLCVIICVGSQPGRDGRTCSFLWQQQRANCRLHLPAQISSLQLTGRVRSQNSLSPPQFLGVPSHSVTCTCFLAPETILGGFISVQWMFPKGVGTGPTPRRWFVSSSFLKKNIIIRSSISYVLPLRFHNTGKPRWAVHSANKPAPLTHLLSPTPPNPKPAAVASSLKLTVVTGCRRKLSRDFIIALWAESCMWPAHVPTGQYSCVTATYQARLSHQSVGIIWHLTTVMLVNRIILASHRCVISLVFISSSGNTICFQCFLLLPSAKKK